VKAKKDALRVNFDKKLKLEFHGVEVTIDAGLLACREIDDMFGLTDMVTCELRECFCVNFQQSCLGKGNPWQFKVIFVKIIDVILRKLCYVTV